MSLTPSRKPLSCQSRRSVGSSRFTQNDASTSNYPGRERVVESSPTARTYPSTPSVNHGIRPPTPEQYLTPLQQKEVCIRHLRTRLRENTERLQNRDFEIDDLRAQLYKMQEEWIEGECHRVEAQLALKEARREIQHLQEVVETVRSNLGVRTTDPPDNKSYTGLKASQPVSRSRSCGCSPASTLTRNTSHKRMSTDALHHDPSTAQRLLGQTHLHLEASLLSEQPPSQGGLLQTSSNVPHSSSFDRIYTGGTLLPLSHSCHSLSTTCRCNLQSYLPHHHLFLHLPQDEPSLTVTTTMSDPIPTSTALSDKKTEVRSQACSPTMTWLNDSSIIEEISIISVSTDLPPSETPQTLQLSLPCGSPNTHLDSVDSSTHHESEDQTKMTITTPQTTQPQPTVQLSDKAESTDKDKKEESTEVDTERATPQRHHWSRYFLVDLLALTMPVVPTMAWLCRGAPRDDMPVYHIGSLLRGCCAVALHSLRRQGVGRGAGGMSNSQNGTL